MTSTKSTERRKYNRRSDEERIADLESRIKDLQDKKSQQKKKTDPIHKEIPKVQRRLRKFAQFAMDHGRHDIANSITAFNAGLERYMTAESPRSARSSSTGDLG